MKITDIRVRHFALPLTPPFLASWDPIPRNRFVATIVEVHTDEGIVGIGSGDGMIGFQDFRHLFIGQDVFQIERHSRVLDTLSFHYARYWPLEIALWDAIGKATGQPIYRLLGGDAARLPAYCSTGELHDPVQRAEEAVRIRELGFRALKIRFHHADYRQDLAVVEKTRAAVGDEMAIMVDANQGWRMPGDVGTSWDRRTAETVARALEGLGVYWLEEPLHRHDYDGLAELRRRTSLRIAGGELNRSLAEFREYVLHGSLDVLQPDVALSGGFSWGREIVALCRQHNLVYSPHTWGNGIGLAANLHMAAASGLCPYLEYPFDPPGWTEERRDFILAEPLLVGPDGCLEVPDRPGLGVELAEDLERFEIR